jgi:signal transduction histidine kinase
MFWAARLRLAVWYVLFLGIILTGLDVGVASLMKTSLKNNLLNDLQQRALQARSAILEDGGTTYLEKNVLGSDPGWSEVSLFATSSSGTVLLQANPVAQKILPDRASLDDAMSGRAAPDPSGVTPGTYATRGQGSNAILIFTLPVYRHGTSGGAGDIIGVVQVARPMRSIGEVMNNLIVVLVAASVLALAIAFVSGFWLAGRVMEPIRVSLQHQKQFVGDASHELRTPVTVIRTAAESMLRQPEPLTDRTKRLAEDIVAESAQMSRLVEDLGVLSAADSRRARLHLAPIEVGRLLAGAAGSAALLAQGAGIGLETQIDATGTLLADPVRIRQLVNILVDNAVKFSPEGGAVVMSATTAGRRLFLRVTDRGPGISHDELPKIFQRFYRGEGERHKEGTGLGLAIARWITEEHHGTITVRSVVGEGSEFTVELPLVPPQRSGSLGAPSS